MLNFKNVYLISIKKMLKKPLCYCISGGALLATLFIVLFIPAITFGGIGEYYESDTWTHIVFAGLIVIIGISSAIFGEINAINNEKVYFLSKPIKRSTFLFAKCLISFTWSIITTVICSLSLITIAIFEYFTANKENIFKASVGNNAASIFISFAIICLFCSICSTIWTYLIKQAYSAIIFVCLVLIYAILFPLLMQLDYGDLDDLQRLLWVTLPIGIYSILGIVFGGIGSYLFLKSEVES